MNYKRFKIKSKRSEFWFWVYVYPEVTSLIDAAKKHAEETGEDSNFVKTAGVCHTYERYRIDKDGGEELLKQIGIIRLSETRLQTEIVSHEVLHAAMHLYRMTYRQHGAKGSASFGLGCNHREEKLCYLYGELFHAMNIKLHGRKLWR